MEYTIPRYRLVVLVLITLCIILHYIYPASGEWPMFRYDQPHTGRNSSYTVECDGAILWTYTTGGNVTSSPVQALNGTIYIGSDDNVFYAYSETG